MKQLNFNTVLLLLVGALVTLGVKKMDENNTILIQVATDQKNLFRRVEYLEGKVSSVEQRFEADHEDIIRKLLGK